MQKISPKNIAEAVYEATEGKSTAEQELILKRTVHILQDKRLLGKSKYILKPCKILSIKKQIQSDSK